MGAARLRGSRCGQRDEACCIDRETSLSCGGGEERLALNRLLMISMPVGRRLIAEFVPHFVAPVSHRPGSIRACRGHGSWYSRDFSHPDLSHPEP